jgi:hypothetical protein
VVRENTGVAVAELVEQPGRAFDVADTTGIDR